jgi:hypothetical protein
MPGTVSDDARTLDPVSYIRQLGLRPEDSYGFVPMKLDEGSSLLYLYRDRPEYEERRPKLAPPVEATRFGPVQIDPLQQVEMEAPASGGGLGNLGEIVEQAQKLQEAWGGAPAAPMGSPGDSVSSPDPDKLVRLAKLRESGAISAEEYQGLVGEQGTPTTTTAGETTGAPSGGPEIVAQRLYPGIRRRSSTRQLNHFLPIYLETVGLRPEDTYGVFPFGTRYSSGGSDGGDTTEWDDYWIVYRDRPEYASGREAYAAAMDKKGRWPAPVVAPGVGEGPEGTTGVGKLKVEKDGWPRKALVVKQTGSELADSLREKISKWGYEPEDSYGFCPNFPHRSIYFGWRKA